MFKVIQTCVSSKVFGLKFKTIFFHPPNAFIKLEVNLLNIMLNKFEIKVETLLTCFFSLLSSFVTFEDGRGWIFITPLLVNGLINILTDVWAGWGKRVAFIMVKVVVG